MSTNQSHGPTSEAGKEISSRNAVKHGCCSTETLLVNDESMADFQALEANWFKCYIPKDETETHLLNQVVQADWFLQRANRTLAQVEFQLFGSSPIPINWTQSDHHALQRFMRYQTTRTNQFNKCKKALEDHRKNRSSEISQAQVVAHREERLAVTRAKLEISRAKIKPEPNWEEGIREMRLEAMRLGYLPPDGKL